jgi:hypothetical protein
MISIRGLGDRSIEIGTSVNLRILSVPRRKSTHRLTRTFTFTLGDSRVFYRAAKKKNISFSPDSGAGIAADYGLYGRGVGLRGPVGVRFLSFRRSNRF